MLHPSTRIIQRYLIPGFVTSLVVYLRYRAIVSMAARVQFTKFITFGKGTVVKPYAIISTHNGVIRIGQNCAISSFVHIGARSQPITIGDDVRIGPNVTILGSARKYRKKDQKIVDQGFEENGVTIGNDVLVGAGSVIHDGCRIGDGVVIAAGSIVQGEIASYSIVAGAPARVVWRRM